MPYFKTCPDRGANLDPQEMCDCHKQNTTDRGASDSGGAASLSMNMLEAYRQHLFGAGRSPNTIKTYMWALERLRRWLLDTFHVDIGVAEGVRAVSEDHLLAYYQSLQREEKKRSTCNLFVASIREFFKYIVWKKVRTDNPALSLPHTKKRYGEIDGKPEEEVLYTAEHIQAILQHLQGFLYKTCKKRDLALFVLMCASGLRISEALSLNIRDMESIRQGRVSVIGKGGNLEWAGVGAFALPHLHRYLETRSGAAPDAPLFLSQKGGRLAYNAAWKAFGRFQRACDLAIRGTHPCRHYFITMIAHVEGLMAARDAARHRQVATTNRYIHRLDEVVAHAVNIQPISSPFIGADATLDSAS